MHPPEAALSLAEAMVGELEDFLLSEEILWPLSLPRAGQTAAPRLSLGGLLLRLDQVSAHEEEFTPSQATRALRLLRKWETHQTRWAAALARKARREAKMRLDLWRAYVEELHESARGVDEYPHEVRQRVMAEKLLDFDAGEDEVKALRSALLAVDTRLRGWFRPGAFVWEARLRPFYPKTRYWFLYGLPHPPGPDD